MYRISGVKLAVSDDETLLKEKLERLIAAKKNKVEILGYTSRIYSRFIHWTLKQVQHFRIKL